MDGRDGDGMPFEKSSLSFSVLVPIFLRQNQKWTIDYSSCKKNGWCLSPKFQSNVFGSSKGLKEGFLYSFGQKTARVPWQNSFNLMLILKCQLQICLICTNIREIKFHLVIIVHLVYLFLPFLSRVKLNFLSIDWIQWSLWFPMNIQGLFYHFTTFAWCVIQGRWIEVILQTQAFW